MSLNERQKKFCKYYLMYGDIKKATKQAGYSKNMGYLLMKNPNVKDYLQKNTDNKIQDIDSISSCMIANINEILEYLTKIMRGEDGKTSIKEQLKAAELLGKVYSIFSNKKENEKGNYIIISGEDEILE